MKFTATYRRTLRTSRRFVFENIFDLEHVCVVHRRWFRNLRILVQKPQYVEYRLTSNFYGLTQETLVKGAAIDENRYWYEFITPLARMRVDGEMDGPDGELRLREKITYEHPILLAPFFWILKPLFRRQKDDILHADTSLLERVFELEQKGFQRTELRPPTVIVYGGDGFFGSLVVEDLLKHSDARIVIASRHPDTKVFPDFAPRIRFFESDLNNYESVVNTIHGAAVAICCAGPFQKLSTNLLKACIEQKVHYVDVADDRRFVENCFALRTEIELAGITALTGCSVVPGLSTLLCAWLATRFDSVAKTCICISPGTRHPRGPGSFACLLSTVGAEFDIPVQGGTRRIKGWTGRERVQFPSPMGTRWVYFVVNIADYFLQRLYFRTPTVEFKIGSELDLLNRSLSLVRIITGSLHHSIGRRFIPVARVLIGLVSLLGTSQGGMMVRVYGRDTVGDDREQALCVFAVERGEVIPAILPSLAAQMILAGQLQSPGIVRHTDWISRERPVNELNSRKVQVSIRSDEDQDWLPFRTEKYPEITTSPAA